MSLLRVSTLFAVEDIQHIVWRLKFRNIGILITDHNVHETLNITDRAYLLFEGRILFKGTPEELAANKIVKEKYLGTDFRSSEVKTFSCSISVNVRRKKRMVYKRNISSLLDRLY